MMSRPASGTTGLIRNNYGKVPPCGGAAGLVWGLPAPLRFGAPVLTRTQSVFPGFSGEAPARVSHPSGKPTWSACGEIRRIRARSQRMLWGLIGLWLFICLFVLLALGLHWKL